MKERVWFGLQAAFFVALLGAPLVERRPVSRWTRVVGVGLLGAGAGVAVAGYRALGASHSAWIEPEGERVVRSGIYHTVRHPIYGGWILGALGFEIAVGSPLGAAVALALAGFYDRKTRAEDRRLRVRFADAAEYQSSVKRFVPGVY
jgi:protein-S-isoprenylcysteine O-methyltransferase Ste14